MSNKPRIAILLGDASGVGPEVVVKLIADKTLQALCDPLLLGDQTVLEWGMRDASLQIPYTIIKNVQEEVPPHHVKLLQMPHPKLDSVVTGQVNRQCGIACMAMMEKAVELWKRGEVLGICYAPLNKSALLEADCPAQSETEYFAQLLEHKGAFGEVNMVDNVWTTRVTSHVPIKQVSDELTIESILDNIRLAQNTLLQAGFAKPRIGVAALNPHAGENGRCGREELDVISPAIQLAQQEGIDASGPYSSDTLFIRAFAGDFDAGVTMYHDQGQIALKLKGFGRGVTIGGGFQIPITTCAHGTAFDIVGKGVADSGSMKSALKTVIHMAQSIMEQKVHSI